ncbi:MAG: hypothetical protein MHPDNHAH_01627 [Anaerolineales bacterium]|nr:hypothetical protein [Anaerolineales bacterium]
MYTAKFTQEALDQLAELNKADAQQVMKKTALVE